MSAKRHAETTESKNTGTTRTDELNQRWEDQDKEG